MAWAKPGGGRCAPRPQPMCTCLHTYTPRSRDHSPQPKIFMKNMCQPGSRAQLPVLGLGCLLAAVHAACSSAWHIAGSGTQVNGPSACGTDGW